MSSSNLVSVNYLEETDYGVKEPVTGGSVLKTARFTDESLSGTPQTTESVELRTDRMSAGQVVTGLEVTGDINFELSADTFFDDFFEAAMMTRWNPAETVNTTVDLVPDGTDDQKAVLTLGAEFTNLVPGVLCEFTPAGATLPVIVQITSVDTPSTVFTVATKRGEAAVTAETLDVILPAYLDIGKDQVSFLVGKAYQDVLVAPAGTDENSQTYTGELVSGFSISAAYGEIVSGTFNMMGNGYEQEAPSYSQQVVLAGGTIDPAGTSNPINASIDIPLVTVGDMATDFCVENLTLEFDNGLTPQNCIGKVAATGYTLGTAAVSVNMSIYLSESSYAAFMPDKLTQDPVSMTYIAQNAGGGYAFHLEAIQLSFPDPAATGQNEQTMIEAAGVGKVGAAGESAIRLYKL